MYHIHTRNGIKIARCNTHDSFSMQRGNEKLHRVGNHHLAWRFSKEYPDMELHTYGRSIAEARARMILLEQYVETGEFTDSKHALSVRRCEGKFHIGLWTASTF